MKKVLVFVFVVVLGASGVYYFTPDHVYLPVIVDADGVVEPSMFGRNTVAINEHRRLIDKINRLGYGQTVKLHINSNGGEISSMYNLVNVIKNTKGTVVAVLDGKVYSAAAFIALSCHQVEALEHSYVLIHVPRKNNKDGTADYSINTQDQTEVLNFGDYERTIKPFLSPKEYEDVFIEHKDLVIRATEFKKRFDKFKGEI